MLEARNATVVMFQKSIKPARNISENRKYLSEKHHIYGLKVKVSVLPNGMSIGCSNPFPGSEADIYIYLEIDLSGIILTQKKKKMKLEIFLIMENWNLNFQIAVNSFGERMYRSIEYSRYSSSKITCNLLFAGEGKKKINWISHDRLIAEMFLVDSVHLDYFLKNEKEMNKRFVCTFKW